MAVGSGCSACLLSRTELPKRWRLVGWRRRSSRSSIRIPTGTGPRGRLWTRWRYADNAVGRGTGSSILMSRPSSTVCGGTSWSKRWRRTPPTRGCCCMSSGGWKLRWRWPTGPCNSETVGPHRGQRSRPCWRTCSCITRSTPGWHGSIRLSGLRYADDAVVHCVTERQANSLVVAIRDRMVEVGLRLHPAKTKIVYCKDGKRRLDHEHTAFTFLGYTFRARAARSKNGKVFNSFLPAISKDALNRLSEEVRRWRHHNWTGHTIAEVAARINPIVRGWMQYYGAFYRTALRPLLQRINAYLMRWLRKKYRRLRPLKKALACWQRIISQYPRGFAHWAWVATPW